jgi:hypothetical protein
MTSINRTGRSRTAPGSPPAAGTPRSALSREPLVEAQQRRRMAECCAFFSAERYREAAPGALRETDIRAAQAQIEAVLRERGARRT